MLSTLVYGALALAASSANARALPDQSLTRRHAFGTTGQCAPQPLGSGPVTNDPDTADAFLANSAYSTGANSAKTPAGWSLAYQNLKAASTTGGYLGVEELKSYDVNYCASQCCGFWTGCKSFNIYYERNPTVDPGDNCPDPSSTTRIKCSFWSESLTPSDATNDGQYCASFHNVIAGSNAYNGGCSAQTTSTTTVVTTTTTSSSSSATTTIATTTTTTTNSVSTSTTTKASTTNVATTTTTASSSPATTTSTKASTTTVLTTTPVTTTRASTTISTTTTSKCTTTTPASTPTITACPVAETTYTAADGSTWAICKGADYQGQTNKDVNNISDNKSCAAACSATSGCTKAVFNAQGQVCYVKGGQLTWTVNPKYDTIRQLTGPTPQQPSNDWNTWTQPKKTCFLWVCW